MKNTVTWGIATTVVPTYAKKGYQPSQAFRQMAVAAKPLGIQTIVFHPQSVNETRGTIKGWTKSGESWIFVERQFPDVVYENVFAHLAVQGVAKKLRQYARRKGRPLFNALVPGKYKAYDQMRRVDSLVSYLPITKECRKSKEVLEMLEEYDSVYFKPTGGFGGQGVIRITKEGSMYQVSSDRIKNKKWNHLLNRDELISFVARRQRNMGTHLVQPKIPLVHIDGGQVDFRVMLQRDIQGKWRLIGIVPKVARPGGVVTNIVAGGSKLTLEQIQERSPFREMSQSITDILLKPAIAMSNYWSSKNKTFGIVGYDMGIDAKGNAWFIELNPKPARSLLTKQMRQQSYQLAAEFAVFLAKKNQ